MDAHRDTAREEALFALANRQLGILRSDQLRAAGLGRGAIERRLAARRLTRLHHGIYAFGHTALTTEGLWLAAMWAGGARVLLSHNSAAVFHGMRHAAVDEPIHLSTTGSAKTRPGVVVHRVRTLGRADVFRAHPLVVTTIPRTLIDLADVLPWGEYRAVADSLPQLRIDNVRRAQERAPGRRGAAQVKRLIEADDAHTRSEFERRYLRFSKMHGLPGPDRLNQRVASHRADCIYDQELVVVELDGRAYHQRRAQMRADRARDRDYQRAGYRILRLVWDDLHPAQAVRTAADLRDFLGPLS